MIVFDLCCAPSAHRFEGWFASSDDFDRQQARGLVLCPQCGSDDVAKAPMAPAVPRKGNQVPAARSGGPATAVAANPPLPPEAQAMLTRLAEMQAGALKDSRWVGDDFATLSRAMHYGEAAQETVHGQATLAEARDLLEEGVPVMPLPFPVAPPDKLN